VVPRRCAACCIIACVRRHRIRTALSAALVASAVAAAPASAAPLLPNDPRFGDQWFSTANTGIDAPDAWGTRTSCGTVAIVDTGGDLDHPDLVENLWQNPGEVPNNGKDDDKNGYVDDVNGVDIRNGGAPIDTNGHGTHVAGLVGARGNNALGVTGVCWSAKLMIVKFMSVFGRGNASDAAAGIRYAVKEGARIVNASFGSTSPSEKLDDAIEYAKSKGALVVVAAGNDGKNIDRNPLYPASLTHANILTVAATTEGGGLASFSNYGKTAVDVAAPGDDILSTYLRNGYQKLDGTSMASPITAGVAAMVRQQNPRLSYKSIKDIVRRNADKPSSLSGKTVDGGRANLRRALSAAG
jgi:subtilisin family serine protease